MYQELLDHQDRLNSSVEPDWRSRGVPWLRFVAAEAAHGMELSAALADIQKLKDCLVKIWGYVLSEALVQEKDAAAFLSRYPKTNIGWGFDGYATRCYDVTGIPFVEQWELLVGLAALKAPLYQVLMLLRALMVEVGMSMEEMRELHLATT